VAGCTFRSGCPGGRTPLFTAKSRSSGDEVKDVAVPPGVPLQAEHDLKSIGYGALHKNAGRHPKQKSASKCAVSVAALAPVGARPRRSHGARGQLPLTSIF
jgi:hypothetical protein